MYNRVVFGTLKTTYISEFTDLNRREFLILLSLLIPMVLLGVTANFVLDFIHLPVKNIISNYDVICAPTVPYSSVFSLQRMNQHFK